MAVIIAFAPMALAGCATSGAVATAPASEGMAHDFPASYDVVKAAALEAVRRLDVNVRGTDETPERFQIRFARSASALNWGEAGVVNVMRLDAESARVVVNSRQRSIIHITGLTERQLADQLFAHIAESLGRMRSGS
jgi:hypothetical protein